MIFTRAKDALSNLGFYLIFYVETAKYSAMLKLLTHLQILNFSNIWNFWLSKLLNIQIVEYLNFQISELSNIQASKHSNW